MSLHGTNQGRGLLCHTQMVRHTQTHTHTQGANTVCRAPCKLDNRWPMQTRRVSSFDCWVHTAGELWSAGETLIWMETGCHRPACSCRASALTGADPVCRGLVSDTPVGMRGVDVWDVFPAAEEKQQSLSSSLPSVPASVRLEEVDPNRTAIHGRAHSTYVGHTDGLSSGGHRYGHRAASAKGVKAVTSPSIVPHTWALYTTFGEGSSLSPESVRLHSLAPECSRLVSVTLIANSTMAFPFFRSMAWGLHSFFCDRLIILLIKWPAMAAAK